VALVPAALPALKKAGFEVVLEEGAGQAAGYADGEYRDKGARLVASRLEVFTSADVMLFVRGPGANPDRGADDLPFLRSGQVVAGFLEPLSAPDSLQALARTGVTAFALEQIPRTTRAQAMDALSSMATVAGYKAALLAADHLPRMFPMLMTAAGTVAPAHVFVVGAGVAGLQAIATARRLGAVVQAYDVRPAVKEQIQSLGARFVELPLEAGEAETSGGYARVMDEEFYRRQREMMEKVVADSQAVITTAAVPGKPAPKLITADMVSAMEPGSVVVDLAAERGGNCELTVPGQTFVTENGVTIMGPLNLASTVPYHASQMYSRNLTTFLTHIYKNGQLQLEADDPIIRETMVTRGGEVIPKT